MTFAEIDEAYLALSGSHMSGFDIFYS